MSMNGAAIHRNTYHFYMYVIPKLKRKIRMKNVICVFYKIVSFFVEYSTEKAINK